MKKLMLLLCFLYGFLQMKSQVIPAPVPPRDPPVIEALISLHKTMASAEKEALAKLNLSLLETNQIKKKSIDFKEVKEVLDTRTSSIYSYLVLGARLAYVTKDFYEFIQIFTKFTAASATSLFKKPMCTWYYLEAVNACTREVKNLTATMARLGASQINLMTATMDEKLLIIGEVSNTIDKCKRIIDETYMWCSFVVNNGFVRLFIWDVLNSKVTDQIAHNIITQYSKS